ncbi:MAG: class I SAM-dependent methyltransferase [Ignavibacteria bacterium]|nr:class I SAM-dependent methyltransferase [Ignavibacteria bacterium]
MHIFDSCPICYCNKLSDFKEFGRTKLVKCRSCKIIFQNPQPNTAEIKNFYDELYLQSISRNDVFLKYPQVKAAAEFHLQRIEQRFGKINSILEIGCGNGEFLAALRDLGYSVDGIEISSDGCKYAKSHFDLNLFNGKIEQFKTNKEFDLIIFNHSLEHFPDPKFAIQKSCELLKKNGIVWIVLPNILSTDRFVHGDRWDGWHLPYHLFHFSPNSLKFLLKQAKFSRVELVKTFLNPVQIFKFFISGETDYERKNINQVNTCCTACRNSEINFIKRIIRKPITFFFSGQNMTGFAVK